LSLLALPTTGETLSPGVTFNEAECLESTLVFHYDSGILLVTYGIALLISIFCVLIGFGSTRSNRVDEDLNFSRWLDVLVYQELLDKLNELTTFGDKTLFTVNTAHSGSENFGRITVKTDCDLPKGVEVSDLPQGHVAVSDLQQDGMKADLEQ